MKLLGTLLIFYLVLSAVMFGLQRSLMYMPDTNLALPALYGLQGVERVSIEAEDGIRLTAWYAPAATGKSTIMYLHGNGGHVGYRAGFYAEAMRRGFGLLALSYRGFGDSEGSPSEAGLYTDARAALTFLIEHKQVSEQQIILFGESIGGAVAIEAARQRPIRALILQAPFASMLERASDFYPWLPVKLLLRDKYLSMDKLGEIITPTLVLVAEEDTIVPASESERLYKALQVPKQLRRFAAIGHNDFAPPQVLNEVETFLAKN